MTLFGDILDLILPERKLCFYERQEWMKEKLTHQMRNISWSIPLYSADKNGKQCQCI